MKIYRHKENKKLYTIEHLILDIYHLNNNEFAGIYAKPYNWKGEQIKFQSQDQKKCKVFVKENFDIVAQK
ncbi:MAG: hypothetical protein ACOCV1_04115 [Bacillota bacterium]